MRWSTWTGPSAVGTAIHPHGRWRFDLAGRADHAGTTRLADRDDPMLTFARIVLAARAAAQRHGAVATCGKVHVAPNGVNAIPSHVTAWLDARGDGRRAGARRGCRRRRGGAVWRPRSRGPTAPRSTRRLAKQLAVLLDDAPLLPTGAGHDAGILAAAGIPTAMLYVRNPTGVSHSPEEHAEDADCAAGVIALTAVLRELLAMTRDLLGRRRAPPRGPRVRRDVRTGRRPVHRRALGHRARGRAAVARRGAARLRQRPQPRVPPGAARTHPRRRRHVLDVAGGDVRRRRPS